MKITRDRTRGSFFIVSGVNNQVELLSNLDTGMLTDNAGVLEKDLSPPSDIDDYYKGWKITYKVTVDEGTTQNIIKYDGTTNIATLDSDMVVSGNINVAPYILTKNLAHSEYVDSLFNPDTYITAINTTTNRLTLSENTKTTSIDAFKVAKFLLQGLQKRTTIQSITNTNDEYFTITLNSDMDSLIKSGVGIELVSRSNVYKTTVHEDATDLDELKIVYTSDINTIITLSTIDDYTINVSGSPTTATIKSVPATDTIELETGAYTNILGWYVCLYSDKHYQIYYDKFSCNTESINTLEDSFSNINGFYTNWILQTEEHFDQIEEVLDENGEKVEDKFTKRTTIMIDDYNGTTKGITGDNFDYTQSNTGEAGRPPLRTGQDAEPSKFNLYLSPSKNVKYGDNMNNTTSNSTKYKINSGYRVDSNKYIETGTMQKENVLSELASEYDDYYKGWEITTYSTITSKNNRLIFLYGSTEHHIDIEDGSYSGDGLATELENKMNSILSLETTPITVSFSGSTNKLTFTSSASTLTFKWKTTCENYFTNIHEVLGFNKTDDSAVSTVTSPNKVQLYISDNGESSLIDSYNGTNKLVSIISLKTRKSHPSVATKTGPFTKYILSPPKHINGSLSIKGENNIYIDNENSIGNDDFYNGWTLLTHTNGIHQFSNITDYDSSTKKITLPSLDLDTLSSSNSLYTIVNKKHLNGYLRKSGNNVFPQGDKKGVLSVSGFTMISHPFLIVIQIQRSLL